MWDLKKNGTDEFMYKAEIESQNCRKQTYGYQAGEMGRDKLGDWNWLTIQCE